MGFDRFDGVSGRAPRGLDVRKVYFGSFPEFEDKTRTAGFDVYPQFEEGKPLRRRLVTILESDEIKNRRNAVKAELGLTGTGKDLRSITKSANSNVHLVDGAAGDAKYYQEQLGTDTKSWEEL